MGKAPFAFISIAFAIGILAGIVTDSFFAGASVVSVALVIALCLNKRGKEVLFSIKHNQLHFAWIILLFIGLGMLESFFYRPSVYDVENDILPPYLIGVVKESGMNTGGCRMIVKAESFADFDGSYIPCGNLKVLVYDKVGAEKNSIIRIPTSMKTLDNIKSIGCKAFYNSLKNQGVLYCIHTNEKELEILGKERGIISYADEIRDKLAISLEKSELDPDTRNFLISIVLGDRSYLDFETRKRFSQAGIAHVLALSGLHVGIIASIILILLMPLRLVVSYKWEYALALIFIWFYAFIAGLSAPTIRACIMITIAFIAVMLEKKNNYLNALFVSGFLIILFSSQSIYDVGFQMSMLCVGVLIMFSGKLNTIDRHRHPNLFKIAELLISALVATAGSWMLAGRYFHMFPMAFLPVNFLILPFFPIFLGAGLIYIISLLSGIDPLFVRIILEKGYAALSDTIVFCSGNGRAVVDIYPDTVAVIIWVAGIIMIAFGLHIRKWKKWLLSAGFSTLAIAILAMIFFPERNEDDGIMVCSENGKTILNTYFNSEFKTVEFPKGHISICKVGENKICWIDTRFDGIDDKIKDKIGGCDIIILSSGCRAGAADIPDNWKAKKLVACSPYNKDFDLTIANEAKRYGFVIYNVDKEEPFIKYY